MFEVEEQRKVCRSVQSQGRNEGGTEVVLVEIRRSKPAPLPIGTSCRVGRVVHPSARVHRAAAHHLGRFASPDVLMHQRQLLRR